MGEYARLYAFLSQILTFVDTDLEKLYQFARHLRRLLPVNRDTLPLDIQQSIDVESYQLRQTHTGRIGIDRETGVLDPQGTKVGGALLGKEVEPLSRIIAELNDRFGVSLRTGAPHDVGPDAGGAPRRLGARRRSSREYARERAPGLRPYG